MANNQLIQGAKVTGKKFLDVGAAVAGGFDDYKRPVNPRVAINKKIQGRVNGYMSKMKTDMDFTSFSPEETSTMRDFLLGQRKQSVHHEQLLRHVSTTYQHTHCVHLAVRLYYALHLAVRLCYTLTFMSYVHFAECIWMFNRSFLF